MTPAEFAGRLIGKPWRMHACSFDAVDCWGLLVLFYRHVHGIRLAEPARTGDTRADMVAGLRALAWEWEPCDRAPGVSAFMAFENGSPLHCGVLLPGDLMLHADGGVDKPGRVRATRLPVWTSLFPDTRFYRHVSQC